MSCESGKARPRFALRSMLWLAASAPALAAGSAAAAPADTVPTVSEVVVTARRVEENLQKVPVAVTALSQAELDRNRIETLSDLQQFVPSASVTGYNSANQEWFTLRGQGQTGLETGGGVGGGPAVVGYLAEVPVNVAGPGLYYDLSSVQVLHGPQGTLFGRNTTGGAILFEPRLPTQELGGYVELTAGDYGRLEGQGAANIPIGDHFAVRIAANAGHRDGYTHDIVQDRDYQERDFASVRVGANYTNGRFGNYLLGTYTDYQTSGSGSVLIFANPGNPAAVAALAAQQQRGIRDVAHSVTAERDDGKFLTFVNRTAFELSDNLTVRNILSWTHWRTSRRVDEDGSSLIILDSTGPLPGTWHKNQQMVTEELQLQGKTGDGRLQWQVGGYYEDSHNPENTTFSQQFAPTFFLNTFRIDQANTSYGLYGQATYEVADGLKLTAGYRHTWDNVSFGVAFAGSAGPIPQPGDPCFTVFGKLYPDEACVVSDEADHDGSSYTLGLDWQATPDILAYVVTRQGYKSGGFNIVATQLGATDSDFYRFAPERVQDVELGLKTTWAGGRGRTNLAAYYSWYRDAQVLTAAVVGGSVQGITANAAEATIWGFEAENAFRPTDWAELNLTYSYLNAGYDSYVTPLGNDLSDTPYPNAPQNKLALGARFRLPTPDSVGEVWLGGTYTFQDEMYVGIGDNGPGSPANTQPSYSLLNLRADWYGVMGSKVDAAVFVTNVTDEEYPVTWLDLYNALGFASATFGEPRMFGVSLRAAF